jgi:hypothetical protein
MNVPFLSTHLDSALALYRQRCNQQQAALVDAQMMARQEQLLLTHLHVLSRSAPLEMEPAKEADFFVDLAVRFLAPSAEVKEEGYTRALKGGGWGRTNIGIPNHLNSKASCSVRAWVSALRALFLP